MSVYKGSKSRQAQASLPVDSRLVALGGLAAVRQGHNLPDGLAKAGISRLSPRDRAFARRLAMHAVRHRRRLEIEIATYLQRPTKDGPISDLLLLGAAQIDMDDVADHAAVNSTVDLAPQRVRGLINAILRRRLREPPKQASAPAVKLSYPDWLFAQIRKQWSGDAESVLAAMNQEPPLCLRINRQRQSRDAYLEQLAAIGVQSVAIGEDTLVLDQTTALMALPGYDEGVVSVQGAAAQFAAELMDLQPELQVLDACAAPGGKTAHMLELQPLIHCVAVDVDGDRMARVAENLQRMGLSAESFIGNAAQSGPWQREYDRILVDAPCSGTGVIGRHPDIKWLRRESDIASLQAQQLALLESAWSMLKSGGLLLYCTCSILRAENDGVLEQFLSTHKDARAESIKLPIGQLTDHGWRIAPDAIYEGFYYGRLRKA